jgi:predicted nucleotidyltransferase
MHALPPLLEENMAAIRALCEQHRVKRLAVFGSAVKGTFDPERSDVDFVVEFFPRERRGFDDEYFLLQADLRDLLGRDVDLVERSAVRNPFFLQVLELSEKPLYVAA